MARRTKRPLPSARPERPEHTQGRAPVSCRPYVCITRAKKHSKMKFGASDWTRHLEGGKCSGRRPDHLPPLMTFVRLRVRRLQPHSPRDCNTDFSCSSAPHPCMDHVVTRCVGTVHWWGAGKWHAACRTRSLTIRTHFSLFTRDRSHRAQSTDRWSI